MLIKERYRVVKSIGKGRFCQTFLAVDEGQFPPLPCVIQQFKYQNQRLEEFSKQLAELSKHPQIPTIYTYFRENNYFYLVQAYIEGENLANLLTEQGTFNETQIWQFLTNILPIVKFIHDHNIIHRDVKPENIICQSPASLNDLFLVDFSTAKLATLIDQLTSETVIGSPEYLAPEQAKGKAVFASDLYSLGLTCIHLLTQISPFDLFDITNNTWVWRQYLNIPISETLGLILDKLLQNSLNKRFQTAAEIMQIMGIDHHDLDSSTSIGQEKINPQISPWQCVHTFTGNLTNLNNVNSLAISPDGKTLATGHDDKNIRIWDLNHRELLIIFAGHTQAIKSVAFSPDGKILATASDDKTIKLWHINTWEEICTLGGHTHTVKSVAFSPDSQMLASGSWDKTIKIWDVNTRREISTLQGHKLQINAVAFSPNGKILASASSDRTIHLWELQKLQNRPCFSPLGILSGHTWTVLTVAFSPDGRILATGSDDNTIKLWNPYTGQLISTLSGHSWSVVAVAFTADGETLISASWDQTIQLWQVSTGVKIATLVGHLDSVTTVAVSPVAQLIASGSRDKTIKLWQLVEQQGS